MGLVHVVNIVTYLVLGLGLWYSGVKKGIDTSWSIGTGTVDVGSRPGFMSAPLHLKGASSFTAHACNGSEGMHCFKLEWCSAKREGET